ncbi:MAG: hypothetical protein ACT4PP_00635 [Sporichthyaceae bacterium]
MSTSAGDSLGAAAEEAAKLADALGQWLAERSSRPGGLFDLSAVSTHMATGSAQCRLCPICQLIALLRSGSPELTGHLDEAIGSLLHAIRLAVEAAERARSSRRGSDLETIHIS